MFFIRNVYLIANGRFGVLYFIPCNISGISESCLLRYTLFFVRTNFIKTTGLKIGEKNSLLRTLILIVLSFFKYFLVGGLNEKGNCINGIIRKLCFNVRMTFAEPRTRWET